MKGKAISVVIVFVRKVFPLNSCENGVIHRLRGLDSKVGSKDFRHHMVLRVNLAGGNRSSPTGYKEEGKP